MTKTDSELIASAVLTAASPPTAEVSRVAFRPPPFWDSNPELWFGQLESQFHLSGITADSTKFHSVIAAVDSNVLSCAADLVRSPPTENMYSTLKQRILGQYAQSDSARLKHLLQDLTLGDKRPSQLLLEMRNLADNKISDEVLRSLWLQRLPVYTQQILSVSGEALDGLAKVADMVNEVSSYTMGISSVSRPESVDLIALKEDVAFLKTEVERLSSALKSRARGASRSRGASKDNSGNRPVLCWYHSKYGNKARACTQPCTFSENC